MGFHHEENMGFAKRSPRELQRIKRKEGTRSLRPIFYISCEGEKTEPSYFREVQKILRNIHIKPVDIKTSRSTKGSAPEHILNNMKKQLLSNKLYDKDEAWLVLDKDKWSEASLDKLKEWEDDSVQYGVAMSIPQFEAWLLQHFEAVVGKISKEECIKKLSCYLPNYNKGIPPNKICNEQVKHAIVREVSRYKNLSRGSEPPRFKSVGELLSRIMGKSGHSVRIVS